MTADFDAANGAEKLERRGMRSLPSEHDRRPTSGWRLDKCKHFDVYIHRDTAATWPIPAARADRIMPDRFRGVDALLPLKPKVLHVLLAVADRPRHGYSIMQEVLERTGGQVRLWPAALYGLLRELEKLDLIAEADKRPAADEDDERRRYFALTAHGRRVLDADVRRLEAIVHHARSTRALRKPQRA
jgi:DNA-binding PadR family transcriptional regulator